MADNFQKIKVKWAKNPQEGQAANVLDIPDITHEQRIALMDYQQKINGAGMPNFDYAYAKTYGKVPNPDEDDDHGYYDMASQYLDDLGMAQTANEKKPLGDEDYSRIAQANIARGAIRNASSGKPYVEMTDEMRDFLSRGLQGQGIPVTDENLQNVYQFYMGRVITNA